MERMKPRPAVQDIVGAIGYLEVARRRMENADLQARVTAQQAAAMETIAAQIQLLICTVRDLAHNIGGNDGSR
jgi:hypothetical protein